MSITNIIKAAAARRGINHKTLAEGAGLSAQALSNKYNRDSFTAGDLIRIAGAIGCRLAFIDDDNNAVEVFTPADAAPPRRSGQAAARTDQE